MQGEAGPQHRVAVDPFWMDRTTITNAQPGRFAAATGYVTLAERPLDPALYPGAMPEMLPPGALVLRMTTGSVDTSQVGYGRFSLLADLITIGLRSDAKPRPGYLFGSATLDTRTTLGTVIGFWRVGESADQFFDIGAGIRVTALSTDLRVNGNRLPGFSVGSNSSHVDGIAAFRYGMRFAPAWGLTIAADIGGGGSRLSWEALGSLDWHVSQGTTIRLGWRHIGFDQETRRGGTANLELGGPFLAASFRF